MNVLVALCGQWGHILPTLPVAIALRDRGHLVRYAFVDHPPLNELVDGHGFIRLPLTMTRAEEDAIMASGTERVAALTGDEVAEQRLVTWFGPAHRANAS